MEKTKLINKDASSSLTTRPFNFLNRTYRYENGQLLQRVRESIPGFTMKGTRKSKFVWKRPSVLQGIFTEPDFRDPEQVINHFEEFMNLVRRKGTYS